ncbi:VaFE repeat-containing surface-anchored protein [Enterococcus faecalis]|uniref:VaFE repeat-containing surface-anchored protein n=2 Tax=Bacteria TaxID=2 RepID=UPI003CC56570
MKKLYKFFKIFVTLLIVTGNAIPLWNVAYADTGERIQVQRIKKLDEIDVNLKNWDEYSDEYKMSLVRNSATGDAVFCVEPKKEYPSNGSYLTVKSRLENKVIANLILNFQYQKEFISHLDEDAQYAATQCAIFYIVSGNTDDLNVDPVVGKLVNYATSQPDPIEQINNFKLNINPENQMMIKDGNRYKATYLLETEANDISDTQVDIKSNNAEAQEKVSYTIKEKTLEISIPVEVVNSTQDQVDFDINVTTKLASALQLSGYLVPDQSSRQHMATIQAFKVTSNKIFSANAKATIEKPEVPEIKTNATNAKDNTKVIPAEEKVQVKDVVDYKNLIPGKEYELQGKLMDKATGKALVVDGKEVTASKKFTPTNATGQEALIFEFNASALNGKKIVVFEDLKQDGKQVATHSDINDVNQTVEVPEKPEVPEIKTNATNAKDNTKVIPAEEKVQVKDVVDYKNLIPGKEYELQGKLMDKATGKALVVDGKEVTASKKFTPTNATGQEALIFEFNASALNGKKIVVFEDLKQDGKQVATHSDINDVNQTVEVPEKPEVPNKPKVPNNPEPSSKTFPMTGAVLENTLACLGAIILLLTGILIFFKKKLVK